MARLIRSGALRGVLAAAVLASAAGCGGTSATPCDDAAFRAQAEELYVTIATAQNVAVDPRAASEVARNDLRRGVEILRAHLDTHPPCSEATRRIEREERRALALLDEGLGRIERGEAGEAVSEAVTMLGAVELELRPG